MSFPFFFESNFEQGTTAEWSSLVDTGNRFNVRHYGVVGRYNATEVGPIIPFRGAYLAELDLGDTNDHTVISSTITIADTVTAYTRFYLFLGKNLRATADNTFSIYEQQGTANATEAVVGLTITAATGAITIGVGHAAPTVFAPNMLVRGRWYAVELMTTVSTIGAGVATLFLDGAQIATVTGSTNTPILRGVLGTRNTVATTLGFVFFDQVVFDDGRIFPIVERFSESRLVTKSAHLAMGETEILNLTLLPGSGTNCVLKLYDTDSAYVSDENNAQSILFNLTANEPPIDLADVPLSFKRGVYAELSGTGTRAVIRIGRHTAYGSVGRIRDYANRRTNHPLAH